MPTIDVAGATVAYADTGGPGPAILCTPADPRLKRFGRRYRLVTHTGDLEVATALIKALDLAPCHVVGVDAGALVALRLVARRPELLVSAVVIDPPKTDGLLRELVGATVPMLVVSKKSFAERVADTVANARLVRRLTRLDEDIEEHLEAT